MVLLSGLFFGAVGAALIVTLPLHAVVSITGSCGWLLVSAREFNTMRRGYALCRGLRMTAGGEISVLDPEGTWQAVRLLSGSVLLRRVGWLRLEDSRGRQCAELVRGSCRESEDWRRLQVIWQHIGATG